MDKDIEIRKLELEERRLDAEIEHKTEELKLEREQFEASQQKKGFLSQMFSPVGVGVIAALIGLLGTAASSLINSYTERKKQESGLILEMSKISDEKVRSKNLLFFVRGGYLSFSGEYIKFLEKSAGVKEGEQVAPPMTLVTSSDLVGMSEAQAQALAKDYAELPAPLQNILEKSDIKEFSGLHGKSLYDRLDNFQKARLLILHLKMTEVRLPNERTLPDYISSITSLGKDRITAIPLTGLREQVDTSDKFVKVLDILHTPPPGYVRDGSVKTKVRPGNVQITFFRSQTKSDDLMLEIDID